ncbi:hypothetical protein ACFYZ3_22445 [Streptomyces sp. NPDC001599]|uniref:hypothetical protein n=1 Tax=Streptomyces sp. NPDC001599 TaxID=3364591 RepID=UPI0036A587D2
MKHVLRRVRGSLRQGRHHRAFRIPPPRWSPDQQRALRRLAQETPPLDASPPVTAEPETASTAPIEAAELVRVATYLWRARKRLDGPGDPEPKGVRQAGRHVGTALTLLDETGLVVQDHDGAPFHSGLSLEVLGFVDDPALGEGSGEYVKETLEPCVYVHDRRVQTGKVIVRRPAAVSQDRPAPAEPDPFGHDHQENDDA